MKLPKQLVEITKEAAWVLIGNDELTWANFEQCEQFEMTTYEAHGVRIFSVCNLTSTSIVQYYIQDINA